MSKNNKKAKKTNAMRILDQHGVSYITHDYESTGAISGVEVAAALGQDPARTFKTLVAEGAGKVSKGSGSGERTVEHYVFVVPGAAELNLKKAAAAVGEKSIAMIRQKELLPLTGYVHGGCSPLGMKKPYPVTFHITAESIPRIIVSAGKIGYQIDLEPDDLLRLTNGATADIVK